MTNQEIFDKVSAHLLEQNRKSVKKNSLGREVCLYRDDEGNKCAIGCLIPDGLYQPSFESAMASAQKIREVLHAAGVIDFIQPVTSKQQKTINLLATLQGVHDHSDPPSWRERLIAVGKAYDLNISLLENPNG